MKRIAVLLSALTLLAACGGAAEAPEPGAKPGETAPQPTGGNGRQPDR